VTDDERQPWELAEEESGEPVQEAPPTSDPIDESERGRAGDEDEDRPDPEDDAPAERSHPEEGELGAGSQYAEADADEHSDPKGPAGGAGGPR
jgi:hypothetical protein